MSEIDKGAFVVQLNWKICFGLLILFILVVWFFTHSGVQPYIGMKPLEPSTKTSDYDTDVISRVLKHQQEAKEEFLDKDFEYYERKKKEKRYRDYIRRQEKLAEEEWKRQHFPKPNQPNIYEEPMKPKKGEINQVSTISKTKNDKKTVKPWGLPNKSRGEALCSQILSNLLNLEFATYRLDEIKNPETGKPLEIDCYNPETKIGLEYNGPHHSEFPNWTNCSYQDFRKQIARDEFKRLRCHELGIRLIEVPYTIPDVELQDYIINRLQELGVNITFAQDEENSDVEFVEEEDDKNEENKDVEDVE